MGPFLHVLARTHTPSADLYNNVIGIKGPRVKKEINNKYRNAKKASHHYAPNQKPVDTKQVNWVHEFLQLTTNFDPTICTL